MQKREINRSYKAFIYGCVDPKQGTINKNIIRSKTNRTKMSIVRGLGRSAITNYQTLQIFGDNFISLVECKLETGRTHQIRVHMESIKHSLIGDKLYNSCKKTAPKNLDKEIFYGAVFVLPKSKSIVDIYYDICPLPRLFEWNLMHHELLEKSCVDLDGVLCRDPKDHENDDGENYLKFIQNVEPFLFPTVKLGHIVTNRLEKYRQPTESWLTRHGIKYGKLIMLDLPDKKARIEANSYASHKAKAYLETESVLFVESSARQAAEICKMTGRSVYCTDSKEMINPNFLEKNRGRFKRYARKIFNTKEQ